MAEDEIGDPNSPDRLNPAHSLRIQASYEAFWAGPLPPPSDLKQYEEALPGCAERLLAMAEHQAAHRQAMEMAVVKTDTRSESTGLWLAFILVMTVILIGAWLAYTGHIAWGAAFTGIPLVTLAAIFVYGRAGQHRQLDRDR